MPKKEKIAPAADTPKPVDAVPVEPATPADIAVENEIRREIQKFDAVVLDPGDRVDIRQKIEEWRKLGSTLKIADENDKEGYESVDRFWKLVWKKATAIENRRKELKAPYIAIGAAIDQEAKTLVALLNAIKEPAMNRARWYEQEQELRKQREAEAKRAIIQARIKTLIDRRFNFDGQDYIYTAMDPGLKPPRVGLSIQQIEVFKDEEFEAYMQKIDGYLESDARYVRSLEEMRAEKQRQEEEEREKARQAEAQRIADMEAEIQRLRAQVQSVPEKLRHNPMTPAEALPGPKTPPSDPPVPEDSAPAYEYDLRIEYVDGRKAVNSGGALAVVGKHLPTSVRAFLAAVEAASEDCQYLRIQYAVVPEKVDIQLRT